MTVEELAKVLLLWKGETELPADLGPLIEAVRARTIETEWQGNRPDVLKVRLI